MRGMILHTVVIGEVGGLNIEVKNDMYNKKPHWVLTRASLCSLHSKLTFLYGLLSY